MENLVKDHPHLRGEYKSRGLFGYLEMGSPPLAWGILLPPGQLKSVAGITPTCVGNTFSVAAWTTEVWDHPHLRGEYLQVKEPPAGITGSPPLAWGIPILDCYQAPGDGITPTCVGNTSLHACRCLLQWDHPHLRGEYSTAATLKHG